MWAHAANFSRCTSRHKTEISVKKDKKAKEILKKQEPASNTSNKIDGKQRKASPQLNMNMDLERENWALSPILAPKHEIDENPNEILEGKNYSKDY